jgi:copper chaperone CopZ
VSVAVRKLDGVESVDVSLDKASADVRLKPDNHLTLSQLRAAIKRNGYATRDAAIEARGRIVERDGQRVLDLLNGSFLVVSGSPGRPTDDRIVDVTGTSNQGKPTEALTITSIR